MAETLARSLIKLIVTVAILGAIYLFFVKPVLDTTNDAFDQFGGLSNIAEDVQSSFDDAGVQSFSIDNVSGDISDQSIKRLQNCVERAGQDVDALQACATRFQNQASP